MHCTQSTAPNLLAHHDCPATVLNAGFATCLVYIPLPDIAFVDKEWTLTAPSTANVYCVSVN